jgi:hypothetical protein
MIIDVKYPHFLISSPGREIRHLQWDTTCRYQTALDRRCANRSAQPSSTSRFPCRNQGAATGNHPQVRRGTNSSKPACSASESASLHEFRNCGEESLTRRSRMREFGRARPAVQRRGLARMSRPWASAPDGETVSGTRIVAVACRTVRIQTSPPSRMTSTRALTSSAATSENCSMRSPKFAEKPRHRRSVGRAPALWKPDLGVSALQYPHRSRHCG